MPADGAPPLSTPPGTRPPPAALQSAFRGPQGARLESWADSPSPPPWPPPLGLAACCSPQKRRREGARRRSTVSLSPQGGRAEDASETRGGTGRPGPAVSGSRAPGLGRGAGWGAVLLTAPYPISGWGSGPRPGAGHREAGQSFISDLVACWQRSPAASAGCTELGMRARTLGSESAQLPSRLLC